MAAFAKPSTDRRPAGRILAGGGPRRGRTTGLLPDLFVGFGIALTVAAAELRRLRPGAFAHEHLLAAAGAVVALGLTLVASVRRRRREVALLKTLGFTQRQLAASVACQATVASVIGIVVGLPLGVAIGRQLWTLFAHNLDAVPDPTVPVLSVFLVGLGALVFANVVAALPGRSAAHTPTGLVLRAE